MTRRRYATPEESFLANTEPIVGDPGCIIWTGGGSGKGYGQIWDGTRQVLAHRWAYEQEHGPIPGGMEVDHICHNRSCVEISHLRLATHQQNAQNKSGAERGRDLPRGVYRRGEKYMAQVRTGGLDYYLGTFSTIAEASAAATNKRNILFGEYAGRA